MAGTSLLGAGYCLYSSSTVLVLTLGNGVNGFTYDSNVGEFILSHPNVQIPDKGTIYSFNEGNYEVRGARALCAVRPQLLVCPKLHAVTLQR